MSVSGSDGGSDDDYVVGKGKPPKHTQYKKGKSGNPSGRPKGRRSAASIIAEAAFEEVPIVEQDERRLVPKIVAAAKQLANAAAQGDQAALKLMTDFVRQAEAKEERDASAPMPVQDRRASDAALIADLIKRFESRKDNGDGKKN